MASKQENSFDHKLRCYLQKFKENTDRSVRSIAKGAGIGYITLYQFLTGDGGMNGENTYKLITYLGLESEDFDV